MSRPFLRILMLSASLVSCLALSCWPRIARAGMAQAAGSATLAPLGLPSAKRAIQEFKYAFGKEWASAVRSEVKDDLAATRIFSDIVPEGGDLTLTLEVQDVSRSFEDRVQLSGKGRLSFSGNGRFSWSRAGTVVSEGPFDVSHVVTLDRQPWRADLSAGWREVLRNAVVDAVAGAQESGVLDAAAPGTSR